MDLSGRISAVVTAIGTALKGKQDKLVSGDSIKTINNVDILGSGNINIVGSSSSQNLFIQETEPNTTDTVIWVETNSNGNISIWLKEP